MCTMLVTMRDRSCGQVKNYNVHYGSDLNYTLEMCRWLLKPLGVWTLIYHHVGKAERVVSLFLQLTCLSCLLFVILPSAYNMFFMEEDLQNIVKLFGPVGFCTFSAIKYCILGIKRNMFGRCIKHVEKDWKIVRDPYHRAIMLKQASISRFLITVCVVFLYTGGMSYHTVMQFLSKDKTNANVTVRPITYPCFDFLNTQSSPTYEIVFFLHCVSALVQYTITSAGYSLAAIFVTHIFTNRAFIKSSYQCSRMGPAVYEIQWYNFPPRKAYNLILLNAIALYPPKLTAGKIIDLSLSMFGTVVKTSVIYLNLLRTFAT